MHDHRKLGRELELFDTDPLVGAGQVALRLRGGRQLPALHVASAIAKIAAQVGVHSTELWDDADHLP
jgi:hypothetical protein